MWFNFILIEYYTVNKKNLKVSIKILKKWKVKVKSLVLPRFFLHFPFHFIHAQKIFPETEQRGCRNLTQFFNFGAKMCGIFAYLNFNVGRERRYILQVLFNGLRRLEYRGYDSAGICIDDSFSRDPNTPQSSHSPSPPPPLVFRQEGNIESLVKSVYQGNLLNS